MIALLAALHIASAISEPRRDGPALTIEQARAMTPAALADAILPPGHPPIVKAVLHPTYGDPPFASLVGVDLTTAAKRAPEPGFCASDTYSVAFTPVDPKVNYAYHAAPMRPGKLEIYTSYRVATRDPQEKLDCDVVSETFFRLAPEDMAEIIRTVHTFESIQKLSATHKKLPCTVNYIDDEASNKVFGEKYKKLNLTNLDLREILSVSSGVDIPLTRPFPQSDTVDSDGNALSFAELSFNGSIGEVDVEMAMRGAQVKHMLVYPHMPFPP